MYVEARDNWIQNPRPQTPPRQKINTSWRPLFHLRYYATSGVIEIGRLCSAVYVN